MISYQGGSIVMTRGDALIIAALIVMFLLWLSRDKQCKKEDSKDIQR